jgi:FkbM family methyltransferase
MGQPSFSLARSVSSSTLVPQIETVGCLCCRTKTEPLQRLGHNRIDLLKVDIEGAEYTVLQDLIQERIPVTQILIDFHLERARQSACFPYWKTTV